MSFETITFNKPYMTGKELFYIAEAKFGNKLAGDGPFTKRCHQWLENNTACTKALLTHSCTAALEMAAILIDIKAGDEIIMPSFTFVSTANAFVLRGGGPVFVDVRRDTLNMDESKIESAITSRTKAIVPVHYAGVSCEMDTIMDIARNTKLKVVEDAAQGVMAKYKGRALGAIGDLGTYSFHETKNIISGEGGAILINDPELSLRAEIIREKGTNRSQYFRGEVDKYTWQDLGSSYLPGELTAAFLCAQLEEANLITSERIKLWNFYHEALSSYENENLLRRPIIPESCEHNSHMYYVLLPIGVNRDLVLQFMKKAGINAVFHYVPLHSSPAGKLYGRCQEDMSATNEMSRRIIRLPIWIGMTVKNQERVVESLIEGIEFAKSI